MFIFGLPIVLVDSYLPGWFTSAAEVLIGFVIIAVAVRLLMRWHRGYFHVHVHKHEGAVHEHLHVHERAAAHETSAHEHRHRPPGRSRLGAHGIGRVHGIGGSAGVGIPLLAAIPDRVEGGLALLVFAASPRCRSRSRRRAWGRPLAAISCAVSLGASLRCWGGQPGVWRLVRTRRRRRGPLHLLTRR